MNSTSKGIGGIVGALIAIAAIYGVYRAVQPPGSEKIFYVIDTRQQPMVDLEICVPEAWSGAKTDENGFAVLWWPDRLAKEPNRVEVRLDGYRTAKYLGRDVVRPEGCDYVVMIEKKPGKETNQKLPEFLQ